MLHTYFGTRLEKMTFWGQKQKNKSPTQVPKSQNVMFLQKKRA